MKQRKLPLL